MADPTGRRRVVRIAPATAAAGWGILIAVAVWIDATAIVAGWVAGFAVWATTRKG